MLRHRTRWVAKFDKFNEEIPHPQHRRRFQWGHTPFYAYLTNPIRPLHQWKESLGTNLKGAFGLNDTSLLKQTTQKSTRRAAGLWRPGHC